MASLYKDKTSGRQMIQVVLPDGKRPIIRLGKVGRKTGEAIRTHVERLVNHKLDRQPVARDTALWLGEVGNNLYNKLVRHGLAEPRQLAALSELGSFLDRYIKGRTDLKPRTILNLKQVRKWLVKHFGESRDMRTITRGEISDWHRLLKSTLAKATIAMHVKKARQMFADAVDRKFITENPVKGLKAGSMTNASRFYYVPTTDIELVIDACPDVEWRAIFALSRYGGLRVPSETSRLKWSDIDWEKNRITVHSPKTEHHDGRETRLVPLFPELLPRLRDAFEQASEGTRHVVASHRGDNLRTTAAKLVVKAGLKPWGKLFQNMRSSCETDLTSRFPLHVACAWIGNTEAVAKQHYLQVTEAHFADAAGTRDALGDADTARHHRTSGEPQTQNPRKSEGFAQVQYPQGESNPCLLAENQPS